MPYKVDPIREARGAAFRCYLGMVRAYAPATLDAEDVRTAARRGWGRGLLAVDVGVRLQRKAARQAECRAPRLLVNILPPVHS